MLTDTNSKILITRSSNLRLVNKEHRNIIDNHHSFEKIRVQRALAQEKFYHTIFKVVLKGDVGTGKSSILSRFADDVFSEAYVSTLGVDFKIKIMDVMDKRIKLQIWDTSGQERFNTMTRVYNRGAEGALLIYSISDHNSFNNLIKYINELYTEDMVKIIIGNKCDEVRAVSFDEGYEMASKFGYKFFEVSAKTGYGINDMFAILSHLMLNSKLARDVPAIMPLRSEPPPPLPHNCSLSLF
jgi:Ras-related protein Rab-1A